MNEILRSFGAVVVVALAAVLLLSAVLPVLRWRDEEELRRGR